jgi:hypothetical protein
MNYRAWIYAFIAGVPAIFSKPARLIADRIFGILDDGIKFARWIGKGAAILATQGAAFLGMVTGFAVEVGLTLQWLYLVEIPRRVLSVTQAIQRWVTPLINTMRDALQSAINDLRGWVTRRLNELIAAANSLKNWALGEINWVRDYLRNTVGKWYERLTDPVKFAEWIIGAIISALLRYMFSNRDKIARWFLDTSPAFTLWLTKQLEALIGRML